MALVPHTGNEAPAQDKLLPIKPRLVSWTSRIWRESPGRAIPLFKIEARLEVRDIDDRGLQDALRPYAAQMQKIAIYVLHPKSRRVLPRGRSAAWTSTRKARSCSSMTFSAPPTAC